MLPKIDPVTWYTAWIYAKIVMSCAVIWLVLRYSFKRTAETLEHGDV